MQVKDIVAQEEAQVKVQAESTQLIKDDAQRDLNAALPALNAALAALNSLNKNDITEIKSFSKPPLLVLTTMEAVCILFGQKPDWDTAKKVNNNLINQSINQSINKFINFATCCKFFQYVCGSK